MIIVIVDAPIGAFQPTLMHFQAATISMTQILVTVLLSLLVTSAHAGPYEDCILANMKGIQDRMAAFAIRQACEQKTTPRRCRDDAMKERLLQLTEVINAKTGKAEMIVIDHFWDLVLPTEREKCLRDCMQASLWSRQFGECSTD